MKITVNRGREEVVCVCCLSEVQLRELWSLSRDGQFWRQDSWQTGHMSGKTMFEEQWSFLGDYEDGGKKKRVNRCELAKRNLQNYKWENLLWISYTVNRTQREKSSSWFLPPDHSWYGGAYRFLIIHAEYKLFSRTYQGRCRLCPW